MPRHVNPTLRERTAMAPYNFVPLPERIFTVAGGIEVNGEEIKPRWETHDRFVPGTHSGWIDLTIETLTPLYIRGAAVQNAGGAWDDRPAQSRPEPYRKPDGTPAIPGSSLRGMIRILVEVLAFAKIHPVSQAQPFFRDISPGRIGAEYRRRFIEDLGQIASGFDIATGQPVSRRAPGYRARVRAGFLNFGARTIEECCFARIERRLIEKTFHGSVLSGSGPMAAPNWDLQQKPIWVQVDRGERDYFFGGKTRAGRQRHRSLYLRFRKVWAASQAPRSGYEKGVLVITGGIPTKHMEFVFLPLQGATAPIEIPEEVWDRFHDEDQITPWQEQAFPVDRPVQGCRKAEGHLRDREPVFFLTDGAGGLKFLGRAQMFRFPYRLSPEDLVPRDLRDAGLDLAEAMFGTVGDGGAIKGRVHFEDAVATAGGPPWCEEVVVPQLSAPKPTAFQHYLTQDGRRGKEHLTTYLAGDHTTIRGHKFYWHRWDPDAGISQVSETRNPTRNEQIQPVKAGVRFTGRVRFENLTDLELGALLEALQLPAGCCHRLGMGKPLGLGSVRITARLRLVDRALRYGSWQASGAREDENGERFRELFVQAMLEHARASGETLVGGRDGLRQIARLDTLYQILNWSSRPPRAETRYMVIENGDGNRYPVDRQGKVNEFRERPVLPTPHAVAGVVEPPWPDDAPTPASGDGMPAALRGTAADGRVGRTNAPRSAQTLSAGVKAGDTVEVVLLEEKTKKGGWKARHEPSGLAGPVHNSGDVPATLKAGDRVRLVVASVSTREMAFRFPTRSNVADPKNKGTK